ncbi:MAG TPA: L-histidine N(alpha)-methyltransferase [Pseudomonadales bacterium]|nr:L-histidine N(alpha)-methyltransferase [Pseudomonadales bacterium]
MHIHDLKPRLADVREEVRAGLLATPKRISPKFFYDERGSELFEAITQQPEYYPTRTEIGILQESLDEICDVLGRGTLLVEYGSGSSRKIRLLLEGLRPRAYMPIDISRDHLHDAALRLASDYDWLEVHAVCADYSESLALPWRPPGVAVSAFFPGSSIGNFERDAAGRFLSRVHETLGPAGRFLVGVDRRKSRARVEQAYNDADGVTAAFNRNALVHLQSVLGGDVDADAFEHRAFYDEDAGRIEMHLVARSALRFRLGDTEVQMRAGESLHTENSYKYAPEEFRTLADRNGFDVLREWTDAEGLFSVFALESR